MISLKFLGTGSGFSTQFGSNSAYTILGNRLILFDCTEDTRVRLQNSGALNGIEHIDCIITHLHADHFNIGNLALFTPLPFATGNPINIIFPNKEKIRYYMEEILQQPSFITGVDGSRRDYWNILSPENVADYSLIAHEAVHGIGDLDNKLIPMEAYGYLLTTNDGCIYYSGDTEKIPSNILSRFNAGQIDEIYCDCDAVNTPFPGHLKLHQIEEIFPQYVRNRVTLMHLGDNVNIKALQQLGFKTAR